MHGQGLFTIDQDLGFRDHRDLGTRRLQGAGVTRETRVVGETGAPQTFDFLKFLPDESLLGVLARSRRGWALEQCPGAFSRRLTRPILTRSRPDVSRDRVPVHPPPG